MDYKIILTGIGIVIGFVSYASYFRGIFRGQTKPHVFSWLVWTIINWTAFFAQLVKGGGAGSWITASNALLCTLVAAIALSRGEKNITRSDWYALFGAMGGIVVWIITRNPLTAVILISIVDCFAIYPTFRKTYLKPYEENLFSWSIDLIKFILQLFALKSFNLTTALFPIVIIVNDAALTAMIILRRKSIIKP
ncbi:MAG: hypothetical protein A2751_01925 [Candidatus Doudnabacteria bacterium RIFCSPHIGHO2_01_FULL_46_14]|uniref:Uncharacterized protein n=1 Tax=Candidatus Doudnabacteria bacterium RIFCSPHIGHO2_01_FULL_46_14 TaxID=1817824 RepID=A0A1F5NJW5_9BACT|nr:MAG: hypothetical protein A2751_01925 [Candidatus Doudnabacteria bacterium RIFCSPHIGHO2_01_FULL_46_14]